MVYFIIIISIIIFGILLNILSNKLILNYYAKTNEIPTNLNIQSHDLILFFIQKLHLNVKVQKFGHDLDNYYHIKRKTIVLSEEVYACSSLASVGISMHELGHAIQHKSKSALFYVYYVFSILSRITSSLLLPAIIFLVVSVFLEDIYLKIALIIIICFYIINLISRIIIIPLEKDASKKAIMLLNEYQILNSSEIKIVKRLLNLACFTYVGGFFKSYRHILRKILRGF